MSIPTVADLQASAEPVVDLLDLASTQVAEACAMASPFLVRGFVRGFAKTIARIAIEIQLVKAKSTMTPLLEGMRPLVQKCCKDEIFAAFQSVEALFQVKAAQLHPQTREAMGLNHPYGDAILAGCLPKVSLFNPVDSTYQYPGLPL